MTTAGPARTSTGRRSSVSSHWSAMEPYRFGYAANPRTEQLQPVPEEADLVRDIFTLIADGLRPSEVARMADERGWRTRNENHWTARQVLETVSNPVYTGHFRAANGVRPACHDAIITEDLFQRCAEMRASRRTVVNAPRQRPAWSMLQGRVRCARCGRLMSIHVNRRGALR